MQRDRLLLTEIIDAAERIIDLAAERSADDFVTDRDRRDALLWNYTVLGEAIGQLSDEIKSTHGNVAWAAPVRMRHRIVHGYWSVDVDVLVMTAQLDLPALLISVRTIETSMTPAETDSD